MANYQSLSDLVLTATMDIRLLTAADAEASWHLRLEALRGDSPSFADSAEEHLETTIETARERLASSDPASNFVVGAQRLYQALGFESYGIEPHSLKIGNEYVDDVLKVFFP